MGNIILVLLCITYLLLIPFHIETPKGTGDQNVGILITFYIFLANAALSLILTILITYRGGFDWISSAALWRNIGVGLLWLSMVGGIFITMYMKAEFNIGNKATGLKLMLVYLIYYGGVWLPLLMLVSYYSMLNPDWRLALSPNVYKKFLVLCSTVGLITFAANKPIRKMITANTDEYYKNLFLNEIDNAKTVEDLFWLSTKIKDDSLLTVVFNKIKTQANLEDEMIRILMMDNQFIFSNIYDYIYANPIEHPERLIEPINLNLTKINHLIQGTTLAPWVGAEGFDNVNIQSILRVMYKHFGENREPFRGSMSTIKQTLETPKERNQGNKDTAEFISILNKYKLEVETWLNGK